MTLSRDVLDAKFRQSGQSACVSHEPRMNQEVVNILVVFER